MAGFRGIGDTATTVKMQQDQMAIQASAAAASRAQQDSQFKQSMAQRDEQFAQGMETQKENTAWTRSNEEKKNYQGQQALGRQEARQERQLDIEEFRKDLDRRRTEGELAQRSIQTKLADAELNKYITAAEEDKRARASREKEAMGAFGGLLLAGRMNGGVMPMSAIKLANEKLAGDDLEIVGGGFTADDLAYYNIKNLKDGTTMVKKLTPENQYAMMHGGFDKERADMWLDTYKVGSVARAAAERRKLELDESLRVFQAKEEYKTERAREDPMKQAETLDAMAKAARNRADFKNNPTMTPDEAKGHIQDAEDYEKRSAELRETLLPKSKSAPKPFAVTPEMQSKYGIPPTNRVVPNPQGGVSVFWRDKDGKPNKQDFAPGEW